MPACTSASNAAIVALSFVCSSACVTPLVRFRWACLIILHALLLLHQRTRMASGACILSIFPTTRTKRWRMWNACRTYMGVDDEEMTDIFMPHVFQVSLNDVMVQMSLLTLSFSCIISNSQVWANYGSTFITSPCGRFVRRSMRRQAL